MIANALNYHIPILALFASLLSKQIPPFQFLYFTLDIDFLPSIPKKKPTQYLALWVTKNINKITQKNKKKKKKKTLTNLGGEKLYEKGREGEEMHWKKEMNPSQSLGQLFLLICPSLLFCGLKKKRN